MQIKNAQINFHQTDADDYCRLFHSMANQLNLLLTQFASDHTNEVVTRIKCDSSIYMYVYHNPKREESPFIVFYDSSKNKAALSIDANHLSYLFDDYEEFVNGIGNPSYDSFVDYYTDRLNDAARYNIVKDLHYVIKNVDDDLEL